MIGFLRGQIFEAEDQTLVVDVQGVGYEVQCSKLTVESLLGVGSPCELHIHTFYKAEGVALYGFKTREEKRLFLQLIKVDSVGPKSALNILSAAPWNEIVRLIEDGDVDGLSDLPKISKKTAEHVIVKLKGKLKDLTGPEATPALKGPPRHQMRSEARAALTHLGYKLQDVDRTLLEVDERVWSQDLQSVLKQALSDLSGLR